MRRVRTRGRQGGVTLLVAMLLLIAVLLVGASAARMALQGEQAARAGRDREVAFAAAEDALMDAERDIEGTSPAHDGAWAARSALFADGDGVGFVDGCGNGDHAGLCARARDGAAPAWQAVDLSGAEDGGAHTAAYGDFTGAVMPTGSGALPFQRPRYLIERIPCHVPGEEAGAAAHYCYRVTVIGFGARPNTEVVLQSVYRKVD